MSDRYEQKFAELRKNNQKAFIPFTLLGWPDREHSLKIIQSMIDSGASMLELGWAFSDPMADGRIIQAAAFETLALGFKVTDALDLVKEVRQKNKDIPIGLLVYYNMVLAHGIDEFFSSTSRAGVDGVLVADLPPENAEEVLPAATKYGVKLIFIVSPLTDEARLKLIMKHAGGFIYAVSRLGITGTEERYDEHLAEMINRVHSAGSLPVCIGFGISTPERAKAMIDLGADGVITGSKVIELVDKNRLAQPDEVLGPYFQSMVAALRPSPITQK